MSKLLREIMTTDCVTVTKQDSLFDAAVKMKTHDIGIVPVVDGKKLEGVITDRDLAIRGYAQKKNSSDTVDQVMSCDIITAEPDMTVDEAAKLMASNKIRRLPIVENGNLIGIVAIGDLAVREIHEDEASYALSEISEPSQSV